MISTSFSRSFIWFVIARAASTIGFQIAGVAVGWHVYAMTGRAFDLGLVGFPELLHHDRMVSQKQSEDTLKGHRKKLI